MKNIISTFIILLSGIVGVAAQARIDVVGGVGTGTTPSSAGLIVNRHDPHEEFVFNVAKVEPQFFAGVKSQLQLSSPFFMEAGLLYSMRKSTYDVVYTIIDTEHPVRNHELNETDHQIMLPVNIGVNMGSFDVMSGLSVTHSVSKKSELIQLSGFESEGNRPQLGWQGSVGYYFLRNRIGLEYQGSFTRVGSGMTINDQSLELNNVPGNITLMLSHTF